MRIVDIREKTVSIASPIANAYIDFSKMTCSVVAVITDVIRDGKPVIGYGFNSNGRYGQGALMRDRFLDRITEANPDTLIDHARDNLDPFAIWDTLMKNEKPGGHGERSVAVGTIDMAIWDAVAKIEGKPLYQLLAERYRNGQADDRSGCMRLAATIILVKTTPRCRMKCAATWRVATRGKNEDWRRTLRRYSAYRSRA